MVVEKFLVDLSEKHQKESLLELLIQIVFFLLGKQKSNFSSIEWTL